MMHPALQVSGLTSGYKSSVVLRDLSLVVNAGEALALLGKNGMGKSTLLKSIMGFLPKRQGVVRLGAHDISRMAPHRICRAGLGYAAQEQALFADLSVRDNLSLGMDKEEPLNRFISKMPKGRFEAANGPATICGLGVEISDRTGLAEKIAPLRLGPRLQETIPSFWG